VARFDVTPLEGQRLPLVPGVDFDISSDGTRIVFVGVGPGTGIGTQLWQRLVEDLEAAPIPGTEGALGPVLSPDGQSIAFGAGGDIRVIALRGGPPVTLAAGGNPAWGSDGTIYFVADDIIYRVDARGGEPAAVTAPTPDRIHRFPDPLPGGRGLLISLTAPGPVPEQSRIAVVGPEGGEVREILTGTMARYAASGHIVYATAEGALMAAPFDTRRLEVTGPSVAVVDDVVVKGGSASQFAMSESGTLLHGTGAGRESELVWVSRSGEVESVDSAWTGELGYLALSPDGSRVAVSLRADEETHVWVKQLDRGPSHKLTFEGSFNQFPTWTSDGASVTFASDQAGESFDLWTKRADGSAPAALEVDEDRSVIAAHWSRDGAWLVFRTGNDDAGIGDILALRPRERTTPISLVATGFREQAPALSPDGRWMAFTSNEAGRYEVYVVPFPNAAAKWAISVAGGVEPLWSRDGREIFYRDPQGNMVAVAVETEPTFSPGAPTVLFSAARYRTNLNHRQYDVAPDGRFLMLRSLGEDEESEWILVLNFFEQLRSAVPVP
jgi:serine/threonine-protein kinase